MDDEERSCSGVIQSEAAVQGKQRTLDLIISTSSESQAVNGPLHTTGRPGLAIGA